MGIISNALKSTVTNLTGFAVNTTRAIFGLSVGVKNPKDKNKDIESAYSETLSSSKEVLGLIYEELQKAREQEIANRINQQKNKNLEEESKIKFYSSLVKALTIRQRIKPKTLNPVKPKVVKKKKTPEELAADATKRVEDVKAPTKPSGTPTQPAGTKPSAEKIPKVEPTPVTPAPTTPSTTRIPPAEVSTGTGTGKAARIITAASAGALGIVAAKIAGAESRGASKESYTQANIVKKDPYGKLTTEDIKAGQIVKGNIDVTTGKPFDKSLNEMTIGEVIDLGKRRYEYYKIPDPKNSGKFIYRGGSAMGKYQFIPGTLAEMAKKTYGPGWETHPFDNQAQEDINISFIKNNAERLKEAKIPVTDASLYLMHFFGNPKQTAMVLNGNDDTKMSTILGDFASKQNPGVAAMSIAQYKQHLIKKGFDFQVIDMKSSYSQTPSQNTTGTTMNDMSNSNSNSREDLAKKQRDEAAISAKGAAAIIDASKSAEETNNKIGLGSDKSAYQLKTEGK